MNIVRALEVALPELPERIVRQTPPKLDPRVISKQHIEDGQPVVLVKMPGTDLLFRFSPLQWQLIQMFDGRSSWLEISATFETETGTAVAVEHVQSGPGLQRYRRAFSGSVQWHGGACRHAGPLRCASHRDFPIAKAR